MTGNRLSLVDQLKLPRQEIADADATVSVRTSCVLYTSLTASRTLTLPSAALYPQDTPLLISDESGNCASGKTISIAAATNQTILGFSTVTLARPNQRVILFSNGSNKWTVEGNIDEILSNLATSGPIASAILGVANDALTAIDGKHDLNAKIAMSATSGEQHPFEVTLSNSSITYFAVADNYAGFINTTDGWYVQYDKTNGLTNLKGIATAANFRGNYIVSNGISWTNSATYIYSDNNSNSLVVRTGTSSAYKYAIFGADGTFSATTSISCAGLSSSNTIAGYNIVSNTGGMQINGSFQGILFYDSSGGSNTKNFKISSYQQHMYFQQINDDGSNKLNSFVFYNDGRVQVGRQFFTGVDNAYACGDPGYRWSVVYAGSSTISTSDARLKVDRNGDSLIDNKVSEFTDYEITAAKEIAAEIGCFKFIKSVEEKGEDARLHIGMTVQKVIAILERNKLNPKDYSFICYDSWDKEDPVIAPEQVVPAEIEPGYIIPAEIEPATYDEEGQIITEEKVIKEAEVIPDKVIKESYTTPAYTLKEGREAGDIYSFRESGLLFFIQKGLLANQNSIENRLKALESRAKKR